MAGRPSGESLLPLGDFSRPSDRPVFAVDFEGISPAKTLFRGDPDDPITAALKASGASPATQRDFRMVGADEGLQGIGFRQPPH